MPGDIPIGNGDLLITFDKSYQLRDIYYPYVGQEKHTEGHSFKFGAWVDVQFSWIDDVWDLSHKYLPETLITDVVAKNDRLKLELYIGDTVHFHEHIYIKKIKIVNLENKKRHGRLFFGHDFHIYGSVVGDTAYYDPVGKSIVHYKGERYFRMCCSDSQKIGIDQFATGKKEVGGAKGTWKDAEDGHLGGNAIEQGAVDSTLGFHIDVPEKGQNTAYY